MDCDVAVCSSVDLGNLKALWSVISAKESPNKKANKKTRLVRLLDAIKSHLGGTKLGPIVSTLKTKSFVSVIVTVVHLLLSIDTLTDSELKLLISCYAFDLAEFDLIGKIDGVPPIIYAAIVECGYDKQMAMSTQKLIRFLMSHFTYSLLEFYDNPTAQSPLTIQTYCCGCIVDNKHKTEIENLMRKNRFIKSKISDSIKKLVVDTNRTPTPRSKRMLQMILIDSGHGHNYFHFLSKTGSPINMSTKSPPPFLDGSRKSTGSLL